jgi:hypothetical protein
MDFKLWLENVNIDADKVLQIIQQSPQFRSVKVSPEYWERYAERWGIKGTFVWTRLPVKEVVDLINNKLYIQISKSINQQEVQNKIKSGSRNPMIIGRSNSGGIPYAILDGSHSLDAAYHAGEEWIDAIVPSNSEFASKD